MKLSEKCDKLYHYTVLIIAVSYYAAIYYNANGNSSNQQQCSQWNLILNDLYILIYAFPSRTPSKKSF